jgi:hypothetical protein
MCGDEIRPRSPGGCFEWKVHGSVSGSSRIQKARPTDVDGEGESEEQCGVSLTDPATTSANESESEEQGDDVEGEGESEEQDGEDAMITPSPSCNTLGFELCVTKHSRNNLTSSLPRINNPCMGIFIAPTTRICRVLASYGIH